MSVVKTAYTAVIVRCNKNEHSVKLFLSFAFCEVQNKRGDRI